MPKEALRYIQNAKDILSKSPIEDNRYADDKYVKSACGVAYELHIAGYYRGNLHYVDTIKGALKNAKEFIEKLK